MKENIFFIFKILGNIFNDSKYKIDSIKKELYDDFIKSIINTIDKYLLNLNFGILDYPINQMKNIIIYNITNPYKVYFGLQIIKIIFTGGILNKIDRNINVLNDDLNI